MIVIKVFADLEPSTRGETPPGALGNGFQAWLDAAQARVGDGGPRRASYNPLSAARLLEVPQQGNGGQGETCIL